MADLRAPLQALEEQSASHGGHARQFRIGFGLKGVEQRLVHPDGDTQRLRFRLLLHERESTAPSFARQALSFVGH